MKKTLICLTLLVVTVAFAKDEEKPPCSCNRMYFPVCASNGRTYSNRCLFGCAQRVQKGLYIVKSGECGVPDPPPEYAKWIVEFVFFVFNTMNNCYWLQTLNIFLDIMILFVCWCKFGNSAAIRELGELFLRLHFDNCESRALPYLCPYTMPFDLPSNRFVHYGNRECSQAKAF